MPTARRASALVAAGISQWLPCHHSTDGEVIRRITGRTLGQFFAQDIAEPLNADFHIGTSSAYSIVLRRSPPGAEGLPAELDEDSVAARTFRSPAPVAEAAMTKGWRTADSGGQRAR